MSSIYRDIPSQHSVTIQPQTNLNLEPEPLNLKQSNLVHEKTLDASLEKGHHHCHCEYGQTSFSEDHSCRTNSNSQLTWRQFLLSTIFLFLALSGLLAWSCVNSMPANRGIGLMGRRALDDNSNSTSNQSRVTIPPGTPPQKGQLAHSHMARLIAT